MSHVSPASALLTPQQQQDELLCLFFSHNSATASSLASPAPIASPYPAASYSRFLRSAGADSDLADESVQTEQKEQASFLSDTPTLFSAHSVPSPARVRADEEKQRRRTRHRTVPAAQLAGSEWRKPMQHTLHLPILKELTSHSQATSASITAGSTSACIAPLSSTTSSLPPLSSTLSTVYYQSPAYEHSLHLRTSDDAIAYFSRMGSSSPVKFLYANRAWPISSATTYASPYRPYDLLIVDRKYIHPAEYFTISAHGVVQLSAITQGVAGGGEETESTSLSEWVHQSSMFTLLRSIRFFKHFLQAKLFRLWARNVRYAIYCKQRRRLASSLFLARPSFCSALMSIHDIMAGVRDERLWGVRSGAVYSAEGFGKEQSEVRAAAVKRVEGWVERVEDVLEGVCKGVKDRARLYDHRIANEELSNSRFAQHLNLLSDSGNGGANGSNGKVKSMVKLKEEKRVRLQQLQHANREADMLGEFIRLVDYIEVQTLVSKCVDNTAEFLSLLLTSAKPLFTTSVSFTDGSTAAATSAVAGSLLFTPTSSDIVGLLTSISDMTINSVDSLSRIIAHPKFLPLLSTSNPTSSTSVAASFASTGSTPPVATSSASAVPSPSDCLRVGAVVHADSGYVLMLGEMERRVASGFVGVNDSVRFLEKHRVVWEYGERVKARMAASQPLDEDDFVVAATSSSSSSVAAASGVPVSPITSLTQTLSGLSRWSTQLQHIRDLYSSGLIQCDCRSLKSSLLPIVQDGIARLKTRMVQLFCAGVASATADYAAMSLALRDEPVMLGQYVDYVRLVADTRRREAGEMRLRVKELAGLQALMLDNDMYNANWIATSEQVKYDEMTERSNSFVGEELAEADAKVEARWEEMKGKIMNEIKKWESSIDALAKQCDDNALYTDYNSFGSLVSPAVSQSAHGIRDIQAAIEAEWKRMKEMQKKTEEMQRQQLVLEETSHTFKGLQTLHDKWEKRKKFFAGVESLREREKKFWLGELDKVDVAAMANEVAAMDALAVAYVSNSGVPASSGGTGSGTGGSTAKAVKESERSAEVVKREMELVKNLRTDLNFYHTFLNIMRDLQFAYQVLGHEGYRAAFGSSSGSGTASAGSGSSAGGFGHWKRMKDLKKLDWTQHRATITALVEKLRAESGSGAEQSGGSETADAVTDSAAV